MSHRTHRYAPRRIFRPVSPPCSAHVRAGFTLVELLVSTAVLAMMAGALAMLASTAQTSYRHSYHRSIAAQHARVALGRMRNNLQNAHASEAFPAYLVIEETVGDDQFPNTLVIWRPTGPARDPQGLPLFSELVIYRSGPSRRSVLWEIVTPDDHRTVPAPNQQAEWQAELAALVGNAQAEWRELTSLLHSAPVISNLDPDSEASVQAALRFEVVHRPSDEALAAARDETAQWSGLAWPQDMYGAASGMRQSWCSVEMQLMPPGWSDDAEVIDRQAIPFFTSGAVYYQVQP